VPEDANPWRTLERANKNTGPGGGGGGGGSGGDHHHHHHHHHHSNNLTSRASTPAVRDPTLEHVRRVSTPGFSKRQLTGVSRPRHSSIMAHQAQHGRSAPSLATLVSPSRQGARPPRVVVDPAADLLQAFKEKRERGAADVFHVTGMAVGQAGSRRAARRPGRLAAGLGVLPRRAARASGPPATVIEM